MHRIVSLRTFVVSLGILSLGCEGGSTGEAPPAEPAAPAAQAAEAREEAPIAPPSVAAEPEERPIGVAEFGAPGDQAKRANRAALVHHRAGRYAESLAGFDQAIAASPGYRMARFNRACALSRLGRTDEAAEALEALLHEDLPTFRARIAEDADLAAVRESPRGAALAALGQRLTSRYRAAFERGVPAVTYAPPPPAPDDESAMDQTPFSALRGGVYDPTSGRFVPGMPSRPDTLSASIDVARGLGLVVRGELSHGTCWQGTVRPARLEVFDLFSPGTSLFARAFRGAEVSSSETPGFYARAERDGVRLTFTHLDWADAEERISFRVTSAGTREVDQHLGPAPGTVIVRANSHSRWFPSAPPRAEYRTRGRTLHLPGERTVELSAGNLYPEISSSPDGRWLFVSSTRARCNDNGVTTTRHVADLVDVTAGVAHRVSAGAEIEVVGRFAADGAFYLQVGATVRRYAPGATEAEGELPAGVYLTTPLGMGMSSFDCDC